MAVGHISVQQVSKRYRIYHQRHQTLKELLLKFGRGRWEDLWALRDLSLEIPRGQTVGVIGENGSGKSTLLKLLASILHPDTGSLYVEGRVSSILELGTSFQMEYSGQENIYLYGTMLGLRKREVDERYEDIVRFSELQEFIDNPVKNYSSGMYMRLAFSVAVQVDPDVLLVDEVLAVGDEAFQRKCFARMSEFRGANRTILLVSHDLDAVRRFCDRVIWIDRGRLAGDGDPEDITTRYLETASERIAAGSFAHTGDQYAAPAGAELTGDIRIGEVRLLDRAGKARNLFRQGEPITIEARLKSGIRSGTTGFAISVHRRDGLHCAELATRDDGLEYRVAPGDGAVLAEIPSFPFGQGEYEISIRVYDTITERSYDFRQRQPRFQVQGAGPEAGLVQLHHQWRADGALRQNLTENPAVGS